jgi:hypothetical protein
MFVNIYRITIRRIPETTCYKVETKPIENNIAGFNAGSLSTM